MTDIIELINNLTDTETKIELLADSKNDIHNIKNSKEEDFRNIFYGSEAFRLRELIDKENINVRLYQYRY